MITTAPTAPTAKAEPAASRSFAGGHFAPIAFPEDPALPLMPRLFDPEWVCDAIQARLPGSYGAPERISIRHFNHSIGRRALVSYEVAWRKDRYLPPEYFVAKARGGEPIELTRYPVDDRLPGLLDAAHPDGAIKLVNAHVLSLPARRARVQLIRYRPEYRAVMRHLMGRVRLYARVMRPADVPPFLAARAVATRSGFAIPGLAGAWQDGGIVWLTEIKGKNLRQRIRKGKAPDPMLLLERLEAFWRVPLAEHALRPVSLSRAYSRALRSFRHNLRDHADAARQLEAIANSMGPFVKSWQPSAMAHNDFYDDQMIVMANGEIALVDLEDIAPGDPMLDIGNFLAHLHWSTRFGSRRHTANCAAYRDALRRAALDRFGWDARELAMREAVCLFRVCTNLIRHPRPDWKARLDAAFALVGDCL